MTQSASLDEHVYHESLVHAAMLLHPEPKNVYIGGGGEGATAREVLKHKSVEKVVMCDLDEECCKACWEFMPEWNKGVKEDPRFTLIYDDAKKNLDESNQLVHFIALMDTF